MKIYIASPYKRQKEINDAICDRLRAMGYDVFLPRSIDVDAVTEDDMRFVAQVCYREIKQCDAMVIVHPFGMSVSCEIGYAICLKEMGRDKTLILYTAGDADKSLLYSEAMIMPYINFEAESIDNLTAFIKDLDNLSLMNKAPPNLPTGTMSR
ncbi:MAG: nucleoside 2-deoxyribosyltransferase [Clostridiales bacterium]|jgi:nucleoside 2-deoxyribosyltransferase|nr:nucleoside 2-deoxyribosyltransferase [Clostridiales bacterium]